MIEISRQIPSMNKYFNFTGGFRKSFGMITCNIYNKSLRTRPGYSYIKIEPRVSRFGPDQRRLLIIRTEIDRNKFVSGYVSLVNLNQQDYNHRIEAQLMHYIAPCHDRLMKLWQDAVLTWANNYLDYHATHLETQIEKNMQIYLISKLDLPNEIVENIRRKFKHMIDSDPSHLTIVFN